jgi:cytoskeletal protein CcmA (bactofilin family)
MIGKKPGPAPESGQAASVIGEGSVLEGTFEVQGNLRVDGRFQGKIDVSGTLVIGKSGLVDADVNARSAVVAGTIRGDVHTSEKITLQSGSRLEGDMITSKLVIEEGVTFQGSCSTARGPEAGKAPASASASKKDDAAGPRDMKEVIEKIAK